MTGLFATPGRNPSKIVQRQRSVVVGGVPQILKTLARRPGLEWLLDDAERESESAAEGGSGLHLLYSMLRIDPLKRISPLEALAHPFLADDDDDDDDLGGGGGGRGGGRGGHVGGLRSPQGK